MQVEVCFNSTKKIVHNECENLIKSCNDKGKCKFTLMLKGIKRKRLKKKREHCKVEQIVNMKKSKSTFLLPFFCCFTNKRLKWTAISYRNLCCVVAVGPRTKKVDSPTSFHLCENFSVAEAKKRCDTKALRCTNERGNIMFSSKIVPTNV